MIPPHTSRINIIGTSGSGKTTFSRQLAKKLNFPIIEMDKLFWGPNWYWPSDEEFFGKLKNALSSEKWILDGNYTRTIPIKWEKVEVVIWLDYPFLTTLFQAIRRAIKRSITGEELWEKTGNRESFKKSFLSKDSIILWTIKTHKPVRKKYEEYMKDPKYSHIKFVRIRNHKEADRFLESVRNVNGQIEEIEVIPRFLGVGLGTHHKKSKTMNEFWSYFLQITFHEGKTERWTAREKKAQWLLENLNLKKDHAVLDLGCGDGIIDIWLSRFNCKATAVDRAGSVLNHAKNEDDTQKVDFIQSDLQLVEFPEQTFHGIFIFETLGLLKKEEDLKLLESTYKWLKKGGRIAVDCPIKPSEKNVWKKEFPSGVVHADTSFDVNTRIHELNFEFQSTTEEAFILKDSACSNYAPEAGISRYIYTQEELQKILEDIGYKVQLVPHYYGQDYFALIGIKE